MYRLDWVKRGKRWTVKIKYEEKSYEWRSELMAALVERRQDPTVILGDKSSRVTLPDMPSNIASEPRPIKSEAVQQYEAKMDRYVKLGTEM